MKQIELLAPARDYQTGVVAIEHGADAVYIGAPRFGARQAAANTVEDIARLVDYAHVFGAKVYATLNTIVYESELSEAEQIAKEVIKAGVDALIVQDMAYMRMGLEGVQIHASTQMCNTSPLEVKFLGESGFSRVILERGLTLEQIREIAHHSDVGLEAFVHGAICVGFSGRCYLSRTMSERSGNRGECSQSCRLTYDLEDELGNVLYAGKHLLSVKDMDMTERMEELLDAGVTSFKIEGRLKEPEYVKNVVAHYRQLIDELLNKREGYAKSSSGQILLDFEPDPSRTFSRGRTDWMLGGKHAGVASFDTPKAIGALVGRVSGVGGDWFEVEGDVELAAGDGICFFVDGKLTGSNVNRVEGRRVYPNRMEGIEKSGEIYRNFDQKFITQLQRSRTRRVIDVEATVTTSENALQLRMVDSDAVEVEVNLECPFQRAKDPAMMVEVIQKQASKTGDTIFRVKNVVVLSKGNMPFVPAAVINGMRREAVDRLMEERKKTMENRPPNLAVENREYPFPLKVLGAERNVVNSLAQKFYQEHGVEQIEQGMDLKKSFIGESVMITPYCIRREIGMCLKEGADYRGELFLRRGGRYYRLDFDCDACQMVVVQVER